MTGDGFDNLVIQTASIDFDNLGFSEPSTILYSGANLQEELIFDGGGGATSIGDLDGDGIGDFIIGNTVFLSVPEPSSSVVLATMLFGALLVRRRGTI